MDRSEKQTWKILYFFTEQINFPKSFSEKRKEIDGKWTIILRTNKINFFLNGWK